MVGRPGGGSPDQVPGDHVAAPPSTYTLNVLSGAEVGVLLGVRAAEGGAGAAPVYGYRMSYSRMLVVQARMLAAYVRGGVPAYTGFTVR